MAGTYFMEADSLEAAVEKSYEADFTRHQDYLDGSFDVDIVGLYESTPQELTPDDHAWLNNMYALDPSNAVQHPTPADTFSVLDQTGTSGPAKPGAGDAAPGPAGR